MRKVRNFTVVPSLPKPIEGLRAIANNLWWTWTQDARELFIRLDGEAWDATGHCPAAMLGRVSQARLQEVAHDAGFLAHLHRVQQNLESYLETKKTWYNEANQGKRQVSIAYFSAEFGLHESLPIYSGGLGLLAGDHLKSASGLGLPLTGVGLFYSNGYFRQYLNADGWQQEYYNPNDPYTLPLTLCSNKEGQPIKVSVELPGREVKIQVWRVQVGRVNLMLLDTRLEENRPEDRDITAQLYGGDHEHRVKQEIVLGIGGMRALRALGINPDVFHMNEGHSGFLALERIRELVSEKGLTFEEAREAVTPGNVFTTHTPVPAGIDRFGIEMIERYLGKWPELLKCDRRTFLALGRMRPHDEQEPFNMAVLCIKTSAYVNGVSKLHGEVSQQMFKDLWPEVPVTEIPVTSITNGVHVRSYVSDQLNELFIRYAGMRWSFEAAAEQGWRGPELLPDGELWRVHERRRSRLVTWARERLRAQFKRRGAAPREIEGADEVLDPEALTIGFARRFATYKRATLLLQDIERIIRMVGDKNRPIQFIFAGKAHPKDDAGKRFIQQVVQTARDERYRKHFVFIEDYDISTARYLVQGVDVWLNNPRRPHEASGTSGMKAAANGVLNCSILDGWWCEGYDGTNGWAIGNGEEYEDTAYQDSVESRALYDLLEQHIVPMYYTRGADGLPREWIKRMKRAMVTCIPVFSTHRMVRDYASRFYLPAAERAFRMQAENCAPARDLWNWKRNLYASWAQVRIENVDAAHPERVPVGADLEISVKVHLGPLDPQSVDVQVYSGRLDSQGQIGSGKPFSLAYSGKARGAEGVHEFGGRVPCPQSGRFGYGVRVLPKHPNLVSQFVPGLITWG